MNTITTIIVECVIADINKGQISTCLVNAKCFFDVNIGDTVAIKHPKGYMAVGQVQDVRVDGKDSSPSKNLAWAIQKISTEAFDKFEETYQKRKEIQTKLDLMLEEQRRLMSYEALKSNPEAAALLEQLNSMK